MRGKSKCYVKGGAVQNGQSGANSAVRRFFNPQGINSDVPLSGVDRRPKTSKSDKK